MYVALDADSRIQPHVLTDTMGDTDPGSREADGAEGSYLAAKYK